MKNEQQIGEKIKELNYKPAEEKKDKSEHKDII